MIITMTSKIEGQYTVTLFTKEDSGNFIYKVQYGNELTKFVNNVTGAIEEFNACCQHQQECAYVI